MRIFFIYFIFFGLIVFGSCIKNESSGSTIKEKALEVARDSNIVAPKLNYEVESIITELEDRKQDSIDIAKLRITKVIKQDSVSIAKLVVFEDIKRRRDTSINLNFIDLPDVSFTLRNSLPIIKETRVTEAVVSPKQELIRFDREIVQETFIPKGQWMFGVAFSYSEGMNENFKFLVLDKIESESYSFKVSPMVSYFIKDNIAVGGRIAYSRKYTGLDNLSLDLEGLGFEMSNYKEKSHSIFMSGFIRTYLPLFGNNRFGLFNEVHLSYGYGESRTENGLREDLIATHQVTHNLNFGLTPGVICFINDFVAVEATVDVLGFDFKWYDQKTNQMETGKRTSSSANFKINLLSISLGIVFYL